MARRAPPAASRLTLGPLVAATYFMVAGGPYGLESLLAGCGYPVAVAALLLTPLVWSLPTTLLVGELGAALPLEGGYYAWVRRALGPFWGFQEAWLSLVASIFDVAIYPTLFTLYLGVLFPPLSSGGRPLLLGIAMIAVSGLWNLRGVRAVGRGAEVMTLLLLAPFVWLVGCLLFAATPAAAPAPGVPGHALDAGDGLGAGLFVAMWNYMGWDNASTVAGEVERPARAYPLAMLATLGLVVATYLIPILALWHRGLDPRAWSTGSWVDIGRSLGGPGLAAALAGGGALCGIGMFNAVVLSYSRLPLALADDGYLPGWVARRLPSGAPWVAILLCCLAYMSCLSLGFVRLVELDVVLYGLSLLLEFVALAVLRWREPALPRPFRAPGGTLGATLLGLPPLGLIFTVLLVGRYDTARWHGTLLGVALVAAGPLVYWWCERRRRQCRES